MGSTHRHKRQVFVMDDGSRGSECYEIEFLHLCTEDVEVTECDLRRCSVVEVGVDWSWEGVESCVGAMDSSSLCGYSKSLFEWWKRLGGFMWLLSRLHPLVQPDVEWLFDFDSFST